MAHAAGQKMRGHRVGQGAVVLALSMLVASTAVAGKTDVVVFDDGTEIVGEVKSLVQDQLKFKTDQAGTIYIKWEFVHSVTASAFFEVYDENGDVYYGALEATTEARQLVVTGEDGSVALDMDVVVEFAPIKKTFVERLDGNIDLGLSYTSADSSFQYSLDAAAKYRQRKYSGSVSLTSIQTRRDGADDIYRDDLRFEYTRYHRKRFFGTGALDFSRNSELGIDLRTELGYGFGRYVLVSNRQQLSAIAGFSITREAPSGGGPSTTSGWGVIGVTYHYFLYNFPETDILVDVSVQPSITDWPRTRVNLNLSLRREVIEDFTVSLSVYDNYDSEPPEGAQAKHDLAVVLAVGWTF